MEIIEEVKGPKFVSRQDFMKKFINEIISHEGSIFGGAVRDMIAGVEPNDIDVYFYVRTKSQSQHILGKLVECMTHWNFEIESREINSYDKFGHSKIRVMPYLVGPKSWPEISFKVDFVFSKYRPCFRKLDCIVNGLIMNKHGISFVEHQYIENDKDKDTKVECAIRMIKERKAGMIAGCDNHRIEKMKSKGYDVS